MYYDVFYSSSHDKFCFESIKGTDESYHYFSTRNEAEQEAKRALKVLRKELTETFVNRLSSLIERGGNPNDVKQLFKNLALGYDYYKEFKAVFQTIYKRKSKPFRKLIRDIINAPALTKHVRLQGEIMSFGSIFLDHQYGKFKNRCKNDTILSDEDIDFLLKEEELFRRSGFSMFDVEALNNARGGKNPFMPIITLKLL